MFKFSLVFIPVLLLTAIVSAQENSPGKISGFMFGDYFYNITRDTGSTALPNTALSGTKDLQGFQFRRIYVTYDNEISNSFTARFRLEANDKLAILLKDAFLRWKNIVTGTDLYFGIQPTPASEVVEGFWSYRSLEKTIMDLRGIVSFRDFGVSLKGKFDKVGMYNYSLMIGNNSGTTIETDKFKRFYAQFHFKPNENFQATLYGDLKVQPSITDQNSLSIPQATIANNVITGAVFVGYGEKDKYRVGIEGFAQITQNGLKEGSAIPYTVKNKNAVGVSVFLSLNIKPEIVFVGRYDYYDPNFDKEYKGDVRHYLLGGISWSVDKNVFITPNVQVEMYEPISENINPSITTRITLYYIFL